MKNSSNSSLSNPPLTVPKAFLDAFKKQEQKEMTSKEKTESPAATLPTFAAFNPGSAEGRSHLLSRIQQNEGFARLNIEYKHLRESEDLRDYISAWENSSDEFEKSLIMKHLINSFAIEVKILTKPTPNPKSPQVTKKAPSPTQDLS